MRGHVDVARLLLAAGCDPDVPDIDGMTPLMIASQSGAVELLGLLLEAGARVNYQDNSGTTALMWASSCR